MVGRGIRLGTPQGLTIPEWVRRPYVTLSAGVRTGYEQQRGVTPSVSAQVRLIEWDEQAIARFAEP